MVVLNILKPMLCKTSNFTLLYKILCFFGDWFGAIRLSETIGIYFPVKFEF